MYYVCRVVELGKGLSNEILLEIIDCKQSTLDPEVTNKGFFKAELAEDYIHNLGFTAVTYVVVYHPKERER